MMGSTAMTVPDCSQNASASWCGVRFWGTRDLISALDILTKEAQNELGKTGQTIFFLGDGVQQVAVNGVFDLLSPQTWAPANVARLAGLAGQQAIRVSELFTSPRAAQLAWLELRNKLEVFFLVQNINSLLGISSRKFVPLPELVEKAYSLPPFQALWAVEG